MVLSGIGRHWRGNTPPFFVIDLTSSCTMLYHALIMNFMNPMKEISLETLKRLQDVVMTLQVIKQTSYNYSAYKKRINEETLTEDEALKVISIYESMVKAASIEINNYLKNTNL